MFDYTQTMHRRPLRLVNEMKGSIQLLPKIFAVIIAVATTGLFAWKFKGTPLCLP